MSVQYYDPKSGAWLESCQEGTPCRFPGAVAVPPEAVEGGGEGKRWDGKAWVEYIPPPDSCTALQGRLALGQAMCEQVTVMLPNMDWSARQAWEYATTWHRKSPLLVDLAKAFNMSPEQVDDLFRLAVTLEV